MEEPPKAPDGYKLVKVKDKKTYIREYMNKKYKENPELHKRYKNSLNLKKKYIITDEIWHKYKANLYAIITLKETIEGLDEGIFEKFLMEYKTLTFEKKMIEV